MIDRGDQRRQLRLVGVQLDARLEGTADRSALHLLRDFFERAELPPLQKVQHEQQ